MKILFTNFDADVDVLGGLETILNKYYSSGIDRIISYGKSSTTNNIVGEFVADGSQFYFSINPEKGTVSYSPVGIKKITDSAYADDENRRRLLLINPSIDENYLDKPGFVEGYLDSLFETNFDAAKVKTGAKTVANKAGKTLTCTPGKTYPCGAVCKALGKPCKGLPMPEETKQVAETIATAIPTAKGKTSKNTKKAEISKKKSTNTSTKQKTTKESNDITSQLGREIDKAMMSGDFNQVMVLAKQIRDKADSLDDTKANQHDKIMAVMTAANGFAKPPQVVPKSVVDAEWDKGGLLIGRGTGSDTGRHRFENEEYYVGGTGGTLYGSGTYWWHGGEVKKGDTKPTLKIKDKAKEEIESKGIFDKGVELGYIGDGKDTLRSVLPKDSTVVTQTRIAEEIDKTISKIRDWQREENSKILENKQITAIERLYPGVMREIDKKHQELMSDIAEVHADRSGNDEVAGTEDITIKRKNGNDIVLGPYSGFAIDSDGSYHMKPTPSTPLTPAMSMVFDDDLKAAKVVVDDYMKMEAAKTVLIDKISKTHDTKKMAIKNGKVVIPSLSSNNEDIDTGFIAEPNGKHFDIYAFDSNGEKYKHGTLKSPKIKDGKFVPDSALGAYKNTRDKALQNIIVNSLQPKESKELNKKVNDMIDTIAGESNTNLARFGVIKGYDGVMLNESYEPEKMFVLYNRGKVLTQKDGLSWEEGQQKGFNK